MPAETIITYYLAVLQFKLRLFEAKCHNIYEWKTVLTFGKYSFIMIHIHGHFIMFLWLVATTSVICEVLKEVMCFLEIIYNMPYIPFTNSMYERPCIE